MKRRQSSAADTTRHFRLFDHVLHPAGIKSRRIRSTTKRQCKQADEQHAKPFAAASQWASGAVHAAGGVGKMGRPSQRERLHLCYQLAVAHVTNNKQARQLVTCDWPLNFVHVKWLAICSSVCILWRITRRCAHLIFYENPADCIPAGLKSHRMEPLAVATSVRAAHFPNDWLQLEARGMPSRSKHKMPAAAHLTKKKKKENVQPYPTAAAPDDDHVNSCNQMSIAWRQTSAPPRSLVSFHLCVPRSPDISILQTTWSSTHLTPFTCSSQLLQLNKVPSFAHLT